MSKDKSHNIGDRILNWQPFLPDPKDDMILELAVKGRCDKIVTYNIRDFIGIEQFGLQAITPREFMKFIGV